MAIQNKFKSILNESDANVCYQIFYDKYFKIFDKSFPLQKPQKIKQNKEWFDKELKNLLLKKEKLFKAFLKQKTLKPKRLLPKQETFIFTQ